MVDLSSLKRLIILYTFIITQFNLFNHIHRPFVNLRWDALLCDFEHSKTKNVIRVLNIYYTAVNHSNVPNYSAVPPISTSATKNLPSKIWGSTLKIWICTNQNFSKIHTQRTNWINSISINYYKYIVIDRFFFVFLFVKRDIFKILFWSHGKNLIK